jgi:hypothetical protein
MTTNMPDSDPSAFETWEAPHPAGRPTVGSISDLERA